jgi:UDP-glucose 4-epimerase
MNVLITGVAGLLGSNLADFLIKKDINVVGIDDLSGGYIENVNDKVKFNKLNLITDVDELKNLFSNYKFDYVYHFAAYAAEGLSPFIRNYNYNNNLVSTANIVNCCINNNVKRLVFTSTMAVYGENKTPFDESYIPNPVDPYGVAKYACEMDIRVAGEQHGLDWCIIRPHNVYGKNQNIWDKYRNVLGIWMNLHLNNKPLSIYGDGEQTRAFSYINDSIEPLWNAAIFPEASKQIINLGGIYETSINSACDTLIKVMGGGTKIYLEKRHEVKHAYSTYQKSIDILKFKHKTNLEEGLIDMWSWAIKQPKRSQFIWDKYEVEKGIYNYWKTN